MLLSVNGLAVHPRFAKSTEHVGPLESESCPNFFDCNWDHPCSHEKNSLKVVHTGSASQNGCNKTKSSQSAVDSNSTIPDPSAVDFNSTIPDPSAVDSMTLSFPHSSSTSITTTFHRVDAVAEDLLHVSWHSPLRLTEWINDDCALDQQKFSLGCCVFSPRHVSHSSFWPSGGHHRFVRKGDGNYLHLICFPSCGPFCTDALQVWLSRSLAFVDWHEKISDNTFVDNGLALLTRFAKSAVHVGNSKSESYPILIDRDRDHPSIHENNTVKVVVDGESQSCSLPVLVSRPHVLDRWCVCWLVHLGCSDDHNHFDNLLHHRINSIWENQLCYKHWSNSAFHRADAVAEDPHKVSRHSPLRLTEWSKDDCSLDQQKLSMGCCVIFPRHLSQSSVCFGRISVSDDNSFNAGFRVFQHQLCCKPLRLEDALVFQSLFASFQVFLCLFAQWGRNSLDLISLSEDCSAVPFSRPHVSDLWCVDCMVRMAASSLFFVRSGRNISCHLAPYHCEAFNGEKWFKHTFRFGEASHPGPLCIGTFNPAQMLGHSNTVLQWGKGVWAASETSHTADAQKIVSNQMRQSRFHSIWSPPVPTHSNNAGSLRGKASGCAIFSHLKLAEYPIPMSQVVASSSRMVDAIVEVNGNCHAYIASVYGPTHSNTYCDPWALLNAVVENAFERAKAFHGPAFVVGDFNMEITKIAAWQNMQKIGWVDVAVIAADAKGSTPDPTCRHGTRRSFILANQVALRALIDCEVSETYEFDAHPLLKAYFNLEELTAPRWVWNLPKSTDDFIFDSDLLVKMLTVQ